MTGFGGYRDMRRFSNTDYARIERLFDGLVSADDDADLGQVAQFLRDLDRAYPEEQTGALEASHLPAMIEAARLSAGHSQSDISPAAGFRRPAFKNVSAHGRAIAAFALAALLAFGGAAYAGVLPAPLQHAVATAVQAVGIDLPNPGQADTSHVDRVPASKEPAVGNGAPASTGEVGSSQAATGTSSTSGTTGVNKGGQDLPSQSEAVTASKGRVTGANPSKKAGPRAKRRGVGARGKSSHHGKAPQ